MYLFNGIESLHSIGYILPCHIERQPRVSLVVNRCGGHCEKSVIAICHLQILRSEEKLSHDDRVAVAENDDCENTRESYNLNV
jgi:hypothetical protein